MDYDGTQYWSDVISIIPHEENNIALQLELLADLTHDPNPDRFDGIPPVYEPEKIMVASLGSVRGLLLHSVVGQTTASEEIYYFINDHLGTPQNLLNESGDVVWSADYKPFGEADVYVNSFANNFRFPGQYFDAETGLHYNYHRYYDPNVGRYLKADKLGIGKGFNHLYVYARNSPIIYIDPEGLKCELALRLPIDFSYNSDTNWNEWGKWSLRNTYTEGGQYPAFWINATCICERKRSGTTVTTMKIKWYYLEFCYNECDIWTKEYSRWEDLTESEKPAYDTDTKLLAGGSFMNKSSASMACERKCRNLNH